MEQRYYWGDMLAELRRVRHSLEDDIKKKLSCKKPGFEAGIWIEQLTIAPRKLPATAPGGNLALPPSAEGGAQTGGAPNSANTITLVCRAMNLSSVDSAANTEIAYCGSQSAPRGPIF